MYTVLKDEIDDVGLSAGGTLLPLLSLQIDRMGMPGVTDYKAIAWGCQE